MDFEWSEKKATANLAKHGVSFGEAQTAFEDYDALVIDDPDHSMTQIIPMMKNVLCCLG